MADTHTIPTTAPMLAQLQTEWRRITVSAAELGEVHRWGLPGSPVTTLDEVLRRCGFEGAATTDVDEGDQYLLRLVELAQADTLAARIVLQRILPPLCAVARRYTLSRDQRHELMDELVANAWGLIRSYPTGRRRQRVASNLVRDVTFETLVRPTRRRSAQEVPTQLDLLDTPEHCCVEPLDELVTLLRDAHRVPGVSDGDIAFICQLINHGRPERLAITLDVTPRTVRNRRDAVVHRLRTLVACAA